MIDDSQPRASLACSPESDDEFPLRPVPGRCADFAWLWDGGRECCVCETFQIRISTSAYLMLPTSWMKHPLRSKFRTAGWQPGTKRGEAVAKDWQCSSVHPVTICYGKGVNLLILFSVMAKHQLAF